jgi:hypothetical protein
MSGRVSHAVGKIASEGKLEERKAFEVGESNFEVGKQEVGKRDKALEAAAQADVISLKRRR